MAILPRHLSTCSRTKRSQDVSARRMADAIAREAWGLDKYKFPIIFQTNGFKSGRRRLATMPLINKHVALFIT